MLTVWGRRNSLNVQKVMWLIAELDIPHRNIPAGGSHGLTGTPEFLAMNPQGKVPVIEDDGTVVWESHTILRYLAARHGQPGFWSEDPGTRSRAERWMDWALGTLQPAFLTGVFWNYYRMPPHLRDMARVEQSIEQSAKLFQFLDRQLAQRPFLAGDELSLADIPAGASLYRYFELDIRRPALPHVEAWYERLRQRPAYREHVMVPFDELRGQVDY